MILHPSKRPLSLVIKAAQSGLLSQGCTTKSKATLSLIFTATTLELGIRPKGASMGTRLIERGSAF